MSTRARILPDSWSATVPSKPTPALLTHAPSGSYALAAAAMSRLALSSVTSNAIPATAPITAAVRLAAVASMSVTTTS